MRSLVAIFLWIPLLLASCPPGFIYEQNFNKCYKFYNTPTSFLGAEQICEQLRGNLVDIGNGFENSYISGIAAVTDSYSNYWIGANLLMSSTWKWSNGGNVTYSNWAPGQPTDPSIYQCASVRQDNYLWTKQQCSSMNPFVCSVNPINYMNNTGNCGTVGPVGTTTATPSCPPNLSCSDGFSLFTGNCKCYKSFPNVIGTYQENQNFCASLQGNLAKVDSPDLQSFLHNLITNSSGCCPWLAMFCSTANDINSCKWSDGTYATAGYTNFSPGEPYYASPIYMSIGGKWDTFFSVKGNSTTLCEKPAQSLQIEEKH